MPAPADGAAAVVGELHREVRHQACRCGTVPVVFARLEEDAVAGADDLDVAALTLAEANAFGDPDGLAERVGVPGGARAGCEVDGRSAERGCLAGGGDRVDVDRAGKPVGGAGTRVERVPCELHVSFLLRF